MEIIKIIKFKREQGSKWEVGLEIDENIIIDESNNVVGMVWDIQEPGSLQLYIKPLVDQEKGAL